MILFFTFSYKPMTYPSAIAVNMAIAFFSYLKNFVTHEENLQ